VSYTDVSSDGVDKRVSIGSKIPTIASGTCLSILHEDHPVLRTKHDVYARLESEKVIQPLRHFVYSRELGIALRAMRDCVRVEGRVMEPDRIMGQTFIM